MDMNQNQVEVIEQQLYQDRGSSFRGTARIRFTHLNFSDLCPRKPNKSITARIREAFSNSGCLRLEPKHRIPALINQDILDAAIEASSIESLAALLGNQTKQPPELTLPDHVRVECLQGLHRVEAAKEFLPRRDWWWTVDLYLEGKSQCETVIFQC